DLTGGRLPAATDLGQEVVVAGRAGLVEQLVATIAVDADPRGVDQHARARVGGRDPVDHRLGRVQSTVADARLLAGGPAPGDALAGEVDDRVAARQHVRWIEAPDGIPADRAGARLRAAGDDDRLVAPLAQGLGERRSDQPGGSGDRHAHAVG